jgi:hypothetical protein
MKIKGMEERERRKRKGREGLDNEKMTEKGWLTESERWEGEKRKVREGGKGKGGKLKEGWEGEGRAGEEEG